MKKWSKKQKLIRNIIIISLLAIGIYAGQIALSGFYRDADTAHAASEMTLHYGPSETRAVIAEVGDEKNTRYYLGVYDEWFCVDTVIKDWQGWRIGRNFGIHKIDYQKPLSYSWHIYDNEMVVYGVASDSNIAAVEISLRLGDQTIELRQEELYEDMFFFSQQVHADPILTEIRGYDREGIMICSLETGY